MAKRATMASFTVVCAVGVLVLLSGYYFGTAWVPGTVMGAVGAAVLPVVVGVVSGAMHFGWERVKINTEHERLSHTLSDKGEDSKRPTRNGLYAYHDAQLVRLRSDYELLLQQGSKTTARLFADTFGFTPEDGFETGPLGVTPGSESLRLVREQWERRISMRRKRDIAQPALGVWEDSQYGVFPRRMTTSAELETRQSYLKVSSDRIKSRHGKNPLAQDEGAPSELRKRIERDLGERAALTRKVWQPPPRAR